MWRDNRADQEWSETTDNLAGQFRQSEQMQWWRKGMPLDRCLRAFLTDPDGPVHSVWSDDQAYRHLLDTVIEMEREGR